MLTTLQRSDLRKCRTVEGVASLIKGYVDFAVNAGGRLYYYQAGVYQPYAERLIKQLVVDIKRQAKGLGLLIMQTR